MRTVSVRGVEYEAVPTIPKLGWVVLNIFGAGVGIFTRQQREELAAALAECVPGIPKELVHYRNTPNGVEYAMELTGDELAILVNDLCLILKERDGLTR